MFPRYNILKFENDGQSVVGNLNRTNQGKEKWIDNNYVGSLLKRYDIAFGRWFKEDDLWRFRFDENESKKLSLAVGELVYAIDGYWGERIELVYDKNLSWIDSSFKAEENWDHDHCSICWAPISEHVNTNYFLSSGKNPVCAECYENHVKTRDVSFVPSV